MSKQNRTQGRKKAPVSSHPLFPAIVALWFGALFGLGSLAVRPSLLESLVLSSHLDVILPMTAPPLGMTARILLALTMAVIGIAAGAMIARRIARPKPVERQRRRSAAAASGKTRGYGATTLSDPVLRQPEPEASLEAVPTGRRRALAVEQEERDDYRLHAAPLPGGAPEIFDVTQIDMAEPAAPEPELAEAQPVGYAQPEQAVVAQAYRNVVAQAGPTLADPTQAGANDCLVLDEAAEMPEHRQVFGQPGPDLASANLADAAPAAFAAVPDPEQSFAPQSFAAAPPVATPVLDNPAMTAFESQTPPRRFDSPADIAPFAAQPIASAPAASEPAFEAAPAPHASLVLPQDSAAQRIASADLAELSPVELIERFALALQQRRSSGAVPEGLAEVAASFAAPAAGQIPQTPAVPAVPEPFTPPAAATAPEPVNEPQQFRNSTGFGEAAAGEAPVIAAPSPLLLPAALRPIDFSEYEELDDHQDHVPARSITMPAAAEVGSPLSAPAIAAAIAEPADQSPTTVAEIATEAVAEPDVLDEGYSSLLDLNRPAPLRQTFVRIEEAMAETAQIEPVVIFPGQDTRVGSRFARPTEVAAPSDYHQAPEAPAAPADGVTNLRRFDAPGAAAPEANDAAAPAHDPAEAERALRSALATLQRMSGAA